jgi:hypothetical protein
MILEHHGPIWTGAVHFPILQQHAAAGGLQQTGDHIQHRGLAAAGMADDGDEFAFFDFEMTSRKAMYAPLAVGNTTSTLEIFR